MEDNNEASEAWTLLAKLCRHELSAFGRKQPVISDWFWPEAAAQRGQHSADSVEKVVLSVRRH